MDIIPPSVLVVPGLLLVAGAAYLLTRPGAIFAGSAAVDPYKRRDDLRRMAAETSGATLNERAMAARQLAKVQATLPAMSDEDLLRDLGMEDSLPPFDARRRGEQIRNARRASSASGATSSDPLAAAISFGKRAPYDGEMKEEWKKRAMAVLRKVAKDLHLVAGTYTISFNPGGIAVSGDATLHHDRVYVSLSPSGWSDSVGYARRCAGQKDYGGKWGLGWENHDIPASYEGLVRLVRDLLEPVRA